MSRAPAVAVVDFETLPIQDRPLYPPPPVGVSVRLPGEKRSTYYAFGHAAGNTHTWAEARAAVARAYQHPVVFHNAKFDLDVAEVHLGLPRPAWDQVHDTLFMAFLDDPRARDLGLKGLAERHLGLPPEERDEVLEWLLQHQPLPGVRLTRGKQGEHYAGKWLCLAPPSLLGPYTCGDTDRTLRLFQHLWPKLSQARMLGAYDRERQLLPVLLEMERQGVPVDLPRLRQDVATYTEVHARLGAWVRQRLKAPDLNLDAGEQLAAALIRAGKLDETRLPLTETGKPSTSADALAQAMTDPQLLSCLTYYGQLSTCLRTFMTRWLATAEASGGLIFTTWNQTRGDKGGTRTGRLSSTPNFQNIPNEFKPLFSHEQKGLPKAPFALPPLPRVRGYVTAFPGHVLVGRDFSSQELRVLAHFEDDELREAYVQQPRMDLHQKAAELIAETTGLTISRKEAKTIAFSILYGSGLAKLSEGLGCSMDQAQQLRNAYLNALPGVKRLIQDLKDLAAAEQPLRTWGGRLYYCEEPALVKGRVRKFDYKMLNYLIQASSADQTKAAMVRLAESLRGTEARILLSVHDELLVSAPAREAKQIMALLKQSMEDAGLDVPMTSDGEHGTRWGEMEEYDDQPEGADA